jgi:Kef-type K+ transport system membrane component KefB
MLEEIFIEIGIVLVIAAALAMFIQKLRQPLMIAYIITGVLVGPGLFAISKSSEIFELMSQIGVAFLLFTVGLGLNWRNIKDVGGIALATGVGQVLVCSIIGFTIATSLGFDPITSIYLAVAFSFSSTIIIVKLLMDKEDLDTLYGRISVGFLLVQDFIAMLLLLALSSVDTGETTDRVLLLILLKVVVLVPTFWFVSAKILPRVLHFVARSQEMLFIFSVAWCFLVASVLAEAGFGIEIGALIAGITLSGSVFYREINARVRSLRDFFLVIFFIVLGTRLNINGFDANIVPTVVFSASILLCNPLVAMAIMRILGYHTRTGFLAGTTVAQVSEFSFILLMTGAAAGHIGNNAIVLATAVALVTITISSFLIEHNEKIYNKVKFLFKPFEPRNTLSVEHKRQHKPSEIILFGFHRTGAELLRVISAMKRSYVVVDFDPMAIGELAKLGEPSIYGDAGDENFLEEIKADKAKLIVSTVPDATISLSILSFLKAREYNGTIVVSAQKSEEAAKCYELGATYVIVPSVLSGKKFSELLVKKKTAKRAWASLRGQKI